MSAREKLNGVYITACFIFRSEEHTSELQSQA